MEEVPFPETADEPPYFLLWRIDDVAVPLLCLCVGMALGQATLLGAIGLVVMYLYKKFREGRQEFYVLHVMYWVGVYPGSGLGFFNPYIRVVLP